MTKAVIYARYSSHGQTEQSIEGQLHDGYAYAERMGYQVVGEYIDRALTGTKDQRPDFQRMIRDAEKKTFSVVIVWKLDRFARNRYDSAIYKARLKKYGVRVVSVMEVLFGTGAGLTGLMTGLSAACMLVFSLLYTPCVAAIASVKRELGGRWAAGLVVWQCAIAWVAALIVRLIGLLLGLG